MNYDFDSSEFGVAAGQLFPSETRPVRHLALNHPKSIPSPPARQEEHAPKEQFWSNVTDASIRSPTVSRVPVKSTRKQHGCSHRGCGQAFTKKGDLMRHQKAVHGKPRYPCPETSCTRHLKPFARKDNLVEHQKRLHAVQSNGNGMVLRNRASGKGAEEECLTPGESYVSEDEEMSDEMSVIAGLNPVIVGLLQTKLREHERLLCQMDLHRAKLLREIDALKDTLNVDGKV